MEEFHGPLSKISLEIGLKNMRKRKHRKKYQNTIQQYHTMNTKVDPKTTSISTQNDPKLVPSWVPRSSICAFRWGSPKNKAGCQNGSFFSTLVGGQHELQNFILCCKTRSRPLQGGSRRRFVQRQNLSSTQKALEIDFSTIFDQFWDPRGEEKCGPSLELSPSFGFRGILR